MSFDDSNMKNSSYFYPNSSHKEELENYFYGETSQLNKEESDKSINKKNDLFICLKCNHSPKIVFKTRETIDLFCNCCNIQNFQINNISNYFMNYKNDSIKIDSIVCNTHKIKYDYYCTQCKYDICQKCVSDRISHISHKLFKYPVKDVNYNNIEYYIYNNYKNSIDKDLYFYKLLKSLLYTYTIFPSFNLYESIRSANEFLNSSSNVNNSNEKNNEIVEKIIRLPRELKENANNAKEIIEIKIEENNFYNLNTLCELDLSNLKIMELQENNISDISPLVNNNSNFHNLEILNLARNHINDKNIVHFLQFHKRFPGLKYLDVSLNSLHNVEFFNAIRFLEKLEFLDAGSNRFYKKDEIFISNNSNKNSNSIISNNQNINFENLEELFLTRGSFSSEVVIDLFSHYKFINLKKLVLSGNDLSNLKYLNYFIHCKNLEEINLKNNRITKLDSEKEFKSVKVIYLEYNLIDDINNILEFMEKFPNLTKIGISNNKFDLADEQKQYILENNEKINELI